MSLKEEQICRLCFEIGEQEFEFVDVVTKHMLDVLLLEMNSDIDNDRIMCQSCANIVKKSYYFKSDCINTEKLILSYAMDRKSTKIDIKCIYRDTDLETFKDLNKCRFCLEPREENSFYAIDPLFDGTKFTGMLPILMPEIDLSVVKDSIICPRCKENLECYFNFALNFLAIEGKINAYCQNEESSSKLRLSNVLRFFNSLEDISNVSDDCTKINVIKQEIESFDKDKDNLPFHMYNEIIEEKIDIKDIEGNLEENSHKSESGIMINKYGNGALYKDSDKPQTYCLQIINGQSQVTTSSITTYSCHKPFKVVSFKPRLYQCESCTYKTQLMTAIKDHILIHKDKLHVKTYKCALCSRESKRKYDIERHLLVHNKAKSDIQTYDKMYDCHICSYTTGRKHGLKSHMQIHIDESEMETFKCEMCTFKTTRKYTLTRHMLTHKDSHEVKMYKCPTCSYEGKRKYYLTKHMLTHVDTSKAPMYKCARCGYKTHRKDYLKVHVQVHIAEKLKCTRCSFKTKRKTNLQHHMLVKHSKKVPRKVRKLVC